MSLWTFDGVDISHYQDPVNFDLLAAASRGFFATKASQRHNYVDPTMPHNRGEATRVGFRARGLYHWQSPTAEASILAQVANWERAVGSLAIGEYFMNDAEQFGITEPEVYDTLSFIEAYTQRPSAVYTGIFVDGGRIYTSQRIRMSEFGPRFIHVAAYMTPERLAQVKAQHGLTAFEDHGNQFGSSGTLPNGQHVPGILPTQRCDMNQINNWTVLDACCGYTGTTTQPTEEEEMRIIRNLETLDGFPPGVVKMQHMDNGHWRHLTETDLKAAGIVNSITLGVGMTNAELSQMGEYVPDGGGSDPAPAHFEVTSTVTSVVAAV